MTRDARLRCRQLPQVSPNLVRAGALGAWRLVRGSGVAIVYSTVVVGVVVVLVILGPDTYARVLAESSTNLANLRDRPWFALVASAFVVSSPLGLWQVPMLAVAYAATQRWVGRFGAVLVGALGHVGATLVVATLVTAGLTHGHVNATLVAHETDVGVSYGLACVTAFLVGRVPLRWRGPYVAVLLGYFVAPLVLSPSFTAIGHVVALTLGGLLALLVARAHRRTDTPTREPQPSAADSRG